MWWLVCALLATLLLSRWRGRRRLRALAQQLPGPPPLPIIGNAWEFMCRPEDLIRVFRELTAHGDVVRFWLGPDLNVIISDPDVLKVFLSSLKTSVKGQQYKYMADILGGGILSGSGHAWRRHRKLATPNYGKRAVDGYSGVFNREVDDLLRQYRARSGEQLDIYDNIVRTTTYCVVQGLMGLTKQQTLDIPNLQTIIDETPKMYDVVFSRMTRWWLQIDPVFRLTKGHSFQEHFKQLIRDFSTAVVKHRLDVLKDLEESSKLDLMNTDEDLTSNTQLSVIDRFILSDEVRGQELLTETFTIFTSSQEASAKIASFLLLMMAYHPECQEKLYNEIVGVMGAADRALTNEDLRRMPYLEQVFREVVRLFPIGAILQRSLVEDFELETVTLPAGCSVVIPVYHLHRDPRFWRDPERFDPERFSPEETRRRHPYCYIPFSLGPMDCLGRYFGTKLVKTICARVLREFEVTSLDTYDDMKIVISISVASINGYKMTLHPRKKKEDKLT